MFILVATLAASSLVAIQQTHTQREREKQLLFVGDQYRRAISSYRGVFPAGGSRAWPRSIEDLLNDTRFPSPVHHLRQAYPDPMTGQVDWELIVENNGVVGIRSRSTLKPIKEVGFSNDYRDFERRGAYREWEFRVRVP
ncbi:type II secretion system protein [Hydrogenophaga sp. T2]|uniref:type II secretion system protein n=1 Tax=Hydrogenophaga sp. T2 TaxID=3132823 RepID=UPI003CF13E34